MLCSLDILDQAWIKLGCVLLYLYVVARCQRRQRVPPHQHRELFSANALTFQLRQLRVLAGENGRQQRQSIRFEILHQQPATFAESLTISAKEEIDQQPDSRSEEENQHPRQSRLRSSVFHQ